MTKKLIALDLDGTLLRPDGTISEFTKTTIKDVQNKGHQVVIATGRPYRMAIDHYKTLDLETPLITFNGSLTNLPDREWAYEHSVKLDKKYLVNLLQRHDELEMDFLASEYEKTDSTLLNVIQLVNQESSRGTLDLEMIKQIGRASCRERV